MELFFALNVGHDFSRAIRITRFIRGTKPIGKQRMILTNEEVRDNFGHGIDGTVENVLSNDAITGVECPKCHRLFASSGSMHHHLRKSHGVYTRSRHRLDAKSFKFVCQQCERGFGTAGGLARHAGAMHKPALSAALSLPVEAGLNSTIGRKDEPSKTNLSSSSATEPTDFLIANVVGQLEGLVQRVAFENDLPPRSFTRRVAEYFHALAGR